MQLTQLEAERYSAGRTLEWKGHVPHFVLHGQAVKSCQRCARVRPIEDFPDHAGTWDGSSAFCQDCHAAGL